MKHDMKKISHLLCLAASALLLTTSCMNDFDDMTFADGHYPYGNNAIPTNASITTIQDLKTVKYGSLFNSTPSNAPSSSRKPLPNQLKSPVCPWAPMPL